MVQVFETRTRQRSSWLGLRRRSAGQVVVFGRSSVPRRKRRKSFHVSGCCFAIVVVVSSRRRRMTKMVQISVVAVDGDFVRLTGSAN